MKNKNVPSIRFKGFSGEWEEKRLGEIGSRFDNLRVPITAKNRISGKTPYYGANGIQDYVEGFTHDGEFLLIAEDGASDLINYPIQYVNGRVWVNNHAHVFQAINKFANNIFLKYGLSQVDIKSLLVGGGRAKLNASAMMNIEVILPQNIDEQKEIGSYFYKLDNLISKQQAQLTKLKNLKKASLEKMFPKQGATTPEIRFKGFSGEWEEKRLGEIAPLRGGFAFPSTYYLSDGIPIIRISNILTNGNVDGEYIFTKEESDDSNYLLTEGSILLAMSGATTGKVAVLQNNKHSKYYQNQRVGLFTQIKDIDYSFVSALVRSQLFTDQLRAVLIAGAQPNISAKDIDLFQFYIPIEIKEQYEIGYYFNQLNKTITLNQAQLTKLKNLKKACLDKMFVTNDKKQ